jgi:HD-like signal output (HDOD) protein
MSTHHTGWITRGATTRARPVPTLPASREAVLEAILDPTRLPSVPAAAVKVAEAARRPDCQPGDVRPLIAGDPQLSEALFQTINSARDGQGRQVGSVERAVLLVGLNRVRTLALSLSLPALRPHARHLRAAREHSLTSVSGAIFARELALLRGHPSPEDDLDAALLRDIGVLLIQQTFPDAWAGLMARGGDPLGEEACEREREVFGVDHAEVSAEVLRRWGLPDEIAEPVRHHHRPELLAGTPHFDRAELLRFAGMLTRLEAVAEHPEALDRVLALAAERFSLSLSSLAEFLGAVRPKIDRFADVLNREIGLCPNYASLLSSAAEELNHLAPTRR